MRNHKSYQVLIELLGLLRQAAKNMTVEGADVKNKAYLQKENFQHQKLRCSKFCSVHSSPKLDIHEFL